MWVLVQGATCSEKTDLQVKVQPTGLSSVYGHKPNQDDFALGLIAHLSSILVF